MSGDSWRGSKWLPLLAALPAGACTFLGAFRPMAIGGDSGFMELEVRRIGREWLLTGAWSRIGARHPGPVWAYVLAPLYRLFGSDGRALAVACGVLVTAAYALGVWMVRRNRGGTAAVAATVAALASQVAIGGVEVLRVWNPSPVGPATFLALAALSCGTVRGDGVALVAAAFVAQVHGGAVNVAAVVAVVVVVRAVTRFRARARSGGSFQRSVGETALWWGLAVAMWIPPLWDQVAGTGNLGRLLDTGTSDDNVGWWPVLVGSRGGVVLALCCCLLVAWSRHRGSTEPAPGVLHGTAILVVGLVHMGSWPAPLFIHLSLWHPVAVAWVVTSAMLVVAPIIGGLRPFAGIPSVRLHRVGLVALLALVVVSTALVAPRVDRYNGCELGAAVEDLHRDMVGAGVGPGIVVEPDQPLPAQWAASALVVLSRREGAEWRGGPSMRMMARPGDLADSLPDGGRSSRHFRITLEPEIPGRGSGHGEGTVWFARPFHDMDLRCRAVGPAWFIVAREVPPRSGA